ncbi:MAG: adenylyl-sulfate kinase [Candidatus Melainabacteria bacterium]|jgi:adenylylsulfate kinase|nr:adenylyl-sulfate kinase [Candidatus Melainabacteria bacterium]
MKLKQGLTLWLTGLSGTGKSTISEALRDKLIKNNPDFPIEILDGDAVREHLCADLSFSKKDRFTNIERIAFLAGKISKHDVLVLVPVIAPYQEARKMARSLSAQFVEVYIKTSIEEVIKRDVKGLYKKAIAGEIKEFTGISDPYEEPENPEILIETEKQSVEESVDKIIDYLITGNYLQSEEHQNKYRAIKT